MAKTIKLKTKLIGSAGSLYDLLKQTIEHFYGSSITFTKEENGTYSVSNANGNMPDKIVRKKGNRWRLERVL